MIRSVTRAVLAMALAALAFVQASEPAWADELPDLAVEISPIAPDGDQQLVVVTITNLSDWWATGADLNIETVSPAPAHPLKQDIDDLDPGAKIEINYFLTGACNGHVVKASLTPAVNFEGKKETNIGNNQAQRELCAWAPGAVNELQPGPRVSEVLNPPVLTIPLPGILPEELRPGTHTKTFDLSAARMLYKVTRTGVQPPFARGVTGLQVGWWGDEIVFGTVSIVAQTAVNFDLSFFEQIPNERIDAAWLSFREAPGVWQDEDGNAITNAHCVGTVDLASEPWEGRSFDTLFPTRPLLTVSATLGGNETWQVTDAVGQMASGQLPRSGFVLRGINESPGGSDSCLSEISGIKLEVTYSVP